MKYNILIGGKAGQGINKVAEIISNVMAERGYFSFNYRDYPSLIRGGHNFNILSISDEPIYSNESEIDSIIAMDEKTVEMHRSELKKTGIIFSGEEFKELGKDSNIALASAYLKTIGVPKEDVLDEVKAQFSHKGAIEAVEKGYGSRKQEKECPRIKKEIIKMNGSRAVAQGAINSGIDLYMSYPMTPATGVMHELAGMQEKCGHMVFQPENEIAVVNAALGASFAGAKVMIGTAGGGYDLMTEGLSMQGMSEIPLVVYLACRPGPGTGVPTYSMQDDLDVALRAGHGEFPRIVIAPGNPIEAIEKTNEAFYLSEKFGCLSIILSDKHLAESEFSSDEIKKTMRRQRSFLGCSEKSDFSDKTKKPLKVEVKRKVPGEGIIKVSSYEHDKYGNTTENAELTKINAENRIKKYEQIKKECKKFEMIKIHGNKNSKNLIIGWGSTRGVILDAIKGLDYKFLQVLYLKPLSNEIEQEIKKAKKVILIEENVTGQLGRLIREKCGIKIENRILKYDGRPFKSDELRDNLSSLEKKTRLTKEETIGAR